ncbi:MAG: dimethylmenaquinone methyltransferase [Firmicutes bacterium]|nr:dimethylmenaquinone methyltransferase [Bacillota bacterium]
MKNPGCKIVRDFVRPDKKLIQLFKDLPVANIDDCMSRTAAVDPMIKPMNKTTLLGPAFTVKVPEGDNLMFHKAMDLAQPGDVIVIDAGGDIKRAIFGELMITYCQSRGIAGVIVDGSVRDADALAEMDIAVYAKGVTPNGPYKNGPGEINTPISFGGRAVCPGDIVVGDGDGIVVIKPEEARYIAEQTRKVSEKEQGIMDGIVNKGTYIRSWVDEKLKEIGCEIV